MECLHYNLIWEDKIEEHTEINKNIKIISQISSEINVEEKV